MPYDDPRVNQRALYVEAEAKRLTYKLERLLIEPQRFVGALIQQPDAMAFARALIRKVKPHYKPKS